MSTALILIGFVLFVLAIVGFFKPIPALKIGSKKAAMVVLLLSVGSCVVGGALAPQDEVLPAAENSNVPSGANSEAAQETGIAIGTPVKSREAEITVTKIEQRNQVGNDFLAEKASEGGTLIVVDFTVKNVGDRPLSFYSPKIALIDASGMEYSSDIAKSAAYATEGDYDSKLFSDLNPGITTRGSTVFEVAADRYDPATWAITIDGKKNKVRIQ